jgi:threonine dehydrogenase-like Zn-dependent dehydrogenase
VSDEDAVGWFDRLYVAAEQGEAEVPWDRGEPNPLLIQWAERRRPTGDRALVIGSGLGSDAEYVAGLGFETTAFDISETAIATTRRRFPDSRVSYRVADLLDMPAEWRQAFDVVVESITVQSLPPRLHREAIEAVVETVAPGGTLIVLSAARAENEPVDGPPWPLTPSEIAQFSEGLRTVRFEDLRDAQDPFYRRWRVELRRPA